MERTEADEVDEVVEGMVEDDAKVERVAWGERPDDCFGGEMGGWVTLAPSWAGERGDEGGGETGRVGWWALPAGACCDGERDCGCDHYCDEDCDCWESTAAPSHSRRLTRAASKLKCSPQWPPVGPQWPLGMCA